MILEALVITACLNQKGCDQSKEAYYKQSTDLQAISYNLKRTGDNLIKGNEWLLYALSPGYLIASGREAKFKLTRLFYVEIGRNQQGAGIEWHF